MLAAAAAPRPRKKGRFRVAISDRPPGPPWDPRLPEVGTGARTSQYASNTVRISDVRASYLDLGSLFPFFWGVVGLRKLKFYH